MIGGGVGRSGSPTPRLITSRPAAMAAFFFLSLSAKRYGGSFCRRSDFTNGVVAIGFPERKRKNRTAAGVGGCADVGLAASRPVAGWTAWIMPDHQPATREAGGGCDGTCRGARPDGISAPAN